MMLAAAAGLAALSAGRILFSGASEIFELRPSLVDPLAHRIFHIDLLLGGADSRALRSRGRPVASAGRGRIHSFDNDGEIRKSRCDRADGGQNRG
jgi:hypothetical protein